MARRQATGVAVVLLAVLLAAAVPGPGVLQARAAAVRLDERQAEHALAAGSDSTAFERIAVDQQQQTHGAALDGGVVQRRTAVEDIIVNPTWKRPPPSYCWMIKTPGAVPVLGPCPKPPSPKPPPPKPKPPPPKPPSVRPPRPPPPPCFRIILISGLQVRLPCTPPPPPRSPRPPPPCFRSIVINGETVRIPCISLIRRPPLPPPPPRPPRSPPPPCFRSVVINGETVRLPCLTLIRRPPSPPPPKPPRPPCFISWDPAMKPIQVPCDDPVLIPIP